MDLSGPWRRWGYGDFKPGRNRLLASHGGVLPPIFDEQVRHIGPPSKLLQ